MEANISVVSSYLPHEVHVNADCENALGVILGFLDDNVTDIVIRKRTNTPTVQEYARIIIETDEENPVTIRILRLIISLRRTGTGRGLWQTMKMCP